MKIFETERILVRNFKLDDWKDLQEYISKEEVMKFERSWDCTDTACQKRVEDFSMGDVFLATELKSIGKLIGHVYFNQAAPYDFNTWMLGYIFNNSYYGKGYATEACKGILEYAFRELRVHRIFAKCCPLNAPSWRLLERLNMRREGHSIKCVTFKKTADGEPIWWDEYSYAILENEWLGFKCEID